jgi:hypothetical protein
VGDKKVLIVIALVVVLASVGVIRLLAPAKNTPRPEPAESTNSRVNTPQHMAQPTEPAPQLARDPFAKPAGVASVDTTEPGTRGPDGQPLDLSKFDKPVITEPGPAVPAPDVPLPPANGSEMRTEPALNGCGWEVAGVVMGPKTCAVMRDAAGNEMLVRPGEALDSNTRVIGIADQWVTVRSALTGTIRLRIGGGVVE